MDYEAFLEGIEPVVLGMDKSSCSLDRGAYWSLAERESRRVLSSRYSISDYSEDHFDVEAVLVVSLEPVDDTESPVMPALTIECVFSGHFHGAAPLNKTFVDRFAEESWIVFWPFFRQFVADTTARMSIPPLVVPLALGPGVKTFKQPPRLTSKPTKSRAIASRKK